MNTAVAGKVNARDVAAASAVEATSRAGSGAAFALVCSCVVAASAALAGFAPLGLSVATVFLFAGPHNWVELRYFITRMPARLGRSRNFFALAAAGVVTLTASYAALALGANSSVWGGEELYAGVAVWNSLL